MKYRNVITLYIKMKNKKYYAVRTVPNSNCKIAKIYTPNTYIHDPSLSYK
jgi:hypothetical protein